jgi:hypothetical protein
VNGDVRLVGGGELVSQFGFLTYRLAWPKAERSSQVPR